MQISIKKSVLLNTSSLIKLINYYDKTIELKFINKLLLILISNQTSLKQINQLKILNNHIVDTTQKIVSVTKNSNKQNIQPIFYFSSTLKEVFKYRQKKKKLKDPNNIRILTNSKTYLSPTQINEFKEDNTNQSLFEYKYEINDNKNKLTYLKSRSEIIQYKESHQIKDRYQQRYAEKDLYTAILIPESGSWIRFGFQKNTEINKYKYPIKNQEDEVVIQLDKITQKPVIHLLKEMGLTDLEICQNLHHADFFYFNKPLISTSINSSTPCC